MCLGVSFIARERKEGRNNMDALHRHAGPTTQNTGNRRFDGVAPSAVLMACCTNSGSAAALAERRNTEKNCHQKKIKGNRKKAKTDENILGM
jgi:hypothetical protein